MDINGIKKEIEKSIEEHGEELWKLARYLWENPEYNFKELKSSRAIWELLESCGFAVEKGICGLDTAFQGVYDSGKPGLHIGFLAEYDAVPELRGHTKEFEEACGSMAGKRAVLVGAKAMAFTAADLLSFPKAMEKVKQSFGEMKKRYE